MAYENILSTTNKPTPVFDKEATQVLKGIYAYLDRQSANSGRLADEQRRTNDAITASSEDADRRHKTDVVRSLASERKNRAVNNALFGKIDKGFSLIDTLKTAVVDLLKSIVNILGNMAKDSLRSYDDTTRALRKQFLTSDQIKQDLLKGDKTKEALDRLGIKVSSSETKEMMAALREQGADTSKLTKEQIGAITMMSKIYGTNVKDALALVKTEKDPTKLIQAAVQGSDIVGREATAEILSKTTDTWFALYARQNGGTAAAMAQLQSAAKQLDSALGEYGLSGKQQADVLEQIAKISSGQIEKVDKDRLVDLLGISPESLNNPEKLMAGIQKAISEGRDMRVLESAGMSKEFVTAIQNAQNAFKEGTYTMKSIRSESENIEGVNQAVKGGKVGNAIDSLITGINTATGGIFSGLSVDINELFGDYASMEEVVSGGFKLVVSILGGILTAVTFKGGAAGLAGLGGLAGGALKVGGAGLLAAAGVGAAAYTISGEYNREKSYDESWANNQAATRDAQAELNRYTAMYKDAIARGNKEAADQYLSNMTAANKRLSDLKLEQDRIEYEYASDEKKALWDFEKNEYRPMLAKINEEKIKILQSSLSEVEKQKALNDLEAQADRLEARRSKLQDETITFWERVGNIFDDILEKIKSVLNSAFDWFYDYHIKPVRNIMSDVMSLGTSAVNGFKKFLEFDWLPDPIKKFLGISSGNGTARGESDYSFEDMAKDLADAAKESITTGLENSSASLKNWWDSWSLFANGGVVSSPTNAIIGEAGREAVLPLTNQTELANVLKSLSASEQLGLLKILLGKNTAITPSLVASSLQEVVGNKNVFTSAVATTAANLLANGVPGDDQATVNKILSYAGPYRDLVYSKITSGSKKRKAWYQEALSNAANQDGRDLIRGTYAERALDYGVSQLGKPYILNSLGKLGYVCNELVNAAIQASGFSMGNFRVHGVRATFANIMKGKYSGAEYPNFRIRDDLTPQTAIPGMVFFQDARKNKEGGFQPGHIGLVYYGHQKLHSSGGSASYDKGTFLRDWQTPCRGVTVTPFDGGNYVIGEFPGLFEQASGEWKMPPNSPVSFGPASSALDTANTISSAIKSVSDTGLLTNEEIASLMTQATGVSGAIAAQYAAQAMKLIDGKNQDEIIAVLIEIAKVIKGIAVSNMGNRSIPVSRPATATYH